MMTFKEAKDMFPTYGAAVGDQINFITARALESGKWSGTIAPVRCAVYDYSDAGVTRRQFTLPRDAVTALGVRFENLNGIGRTGGRPIHNQWYSWLDGKCCGDWSTGIIDLGSNWATFRDIPVDAQLRIRTDYEESGDFAIRGVDADGDTIYSGEEPNVIEGEVLDLSENPATTAATFKAGSSIAIVKAITQGPVRIYSWDGTTETLLGIYAPGETVPAWRRYQAPNNSTFEWVLVKAKRQYVEMVADNDLVFLSRTALYNGLKAKNAQDKFDLEKAAPYWSEFFDCLNGSLREEQGNAPVVIKLRTGEGFGSIRQGM